MHTTQSISTSLSLYTAGSNHNALQSYLDLASSVKAERLSAEQQITGFARSTLNYLTSSLDAIPEDKVRLFQEDPKISSTVKKLMKIFFTLASFTEQFQLLNIYQKEEGFSSHLNYLFI